MQAQNVTDSADALQLYRLLSRRSCEGIVWTNRFNNESSKVIGWYKNNEDSGKASPFNILATVLNRQVHGYTGSFFISKLYHEETIKCIIELQKVSSPERGANWSTAFTLLKRFLNDASDEFLSKLPDPQNNLDIVADGGNSSSVQEEFLSRFCSSLGSVKELMFKANQDIDESRAQFLNQQSNSSDASLQTEDLYKVVDDLRSQGFLSSRDNVFYENVIGKNTLNLLKEYIKS